MAWTEPQYSKSQVDVAGDILLREWASQEALIHVSPDELNERDMDDVGSSAPTKIHFVDIERVERAFDVINNWRSSHSYPLNTLTVGLRRQAAHVDTKTSSRSVSSGCRRSRRSYVDSRL